MGWWTETFGWGGKQRTRDQERRKDQMSGAIPAAAVGAEHAVNKGGGETKDALERAANNNDRPAKR